jgi:hypothetical protein
MENPYAWEAGIRLDIRAIGIGNGRFGESLCRRGWDGE